MTKSDLIAAAAKKAGTTMTAVRHVHDALEETVFEHLSMTNSETPTSIKLFEGITIEANYLPERQKKLNYVSSGDNVITVKGGIRAKANITRNYNQKLNAA